MDLDLGTLRRLLLLHLRFCHLYQHRCLIINCGDFRWLTFRLREREFSFFYGWFFIVFKVNLMELLSKRCIN
jgi:hypothetical protein